MKNRYPLALLWAGMFMAALLVNVLLVHPAAVEQAKPAAVAAQVNPGAAEQPKPVAAEQAKTEGGQQYYHANTYGVMFQLKL